MIKKLYSEDNVLVFEADVTQYFANAWRRAMISEVPVMCVDEIEVFKNSSAMFDETLANRLGLLPLKTDLVAYNLPSRCNCKGEGCAKCELKLYLKSGSKGMVYANSIVSKDPAIVPVNPKTPLVYLGEGQGVEYELTAKLGKGVKHAKYAPGLVYFKKFPKITIGKLDNAEAIAKACPKLVFEVKSGKLSINKEKIVDCDLCLQCADLDENIKVESEDNKYIFYIESWGQLSPKEIAITAIEELEIKSKEFENALKDL